ncbi:MAG: hypothetical protein KAS39_07775, partial [Actinomycetia bacterium]|nr:hypothetical protein [Actinomycetes bacterium]
DHYVTAADVSPRDHLRIQAAIQKYVDSGISKTINCSNDTSTEDIQNIVTDSYALGCKSVTIYREGSREEEAQYEAEEEAYVTKDEAAEYYDTRKEILEAKDKEEISNNIQAHIKPYRRGNRLEGCTWKIKTGRGKLYVTVNEDANGLPVEIFAKIGKSGKEDFAYTEALGRIISLSLRSGVPIERIYRHLEGITGFDTVWDYGRLITSVPDAIARILDMEYNIMEHETGANFEAALATASTISPIGRDVIHSDADIGYPIPLCPNCNSEIVMAEGCLKCLLCGFSKCGG